MEDHVSIKRTTSLPPGLDYNALRLRGIQYVQELSGQIWTDYNEHDPGVTLLEHLCFALTDLAYRAGFDIEDILYAEDETGPSTTENGFFPPGDIFPTAPITVIDYRKLLIDRVRDIKNAWFEPIDPHLRGYKGLFRVRLQLADEIDRTQQPEEIKRAVFRLMMSHRNLGEDLEEIIILKTEHLSLAATINIDGDAFGEKVLANILHTIDQTLNPGIRFYSQEELLEEGLSIETIFDGPKPLKGFIKKEDLRSIPDSTNISTLREAIARVKGVKLIDNLKVWKEGFRIQGDDIKPEVNCALSLDPRLANISGKAGSIKLVRNGVPVDIDPQQTRQFLNTLAAKAKKGYQINLNLNTPKPVSSKKKSDIAHYSSFQHLMPAIYGIGADGLPATANRARRAQAYQLKAYLLLFEQFMADYLAQLANVGNLFSLTPASAANEHNATYFTQFPADIPDIHHLYYHGLPPGSSLKEINDKIRADLQQLSASTDPAIERRNRFLDHLLARFGEVYNDDALRFIPGYSQENVSQSLIEGKTAFLRQYPDLSKNRSKAFDYTQNAWESFKKPNESGLKKRVCLLLNLNNNTSTDRDAAPAYQNYITRSTAIDPLIEGATLNLSIEDATDSDVVLPLRELLRYGTQSGNYEIVRSGNKYQLYFQNPRSADQLQGDGAAGDRPAALRGAKQYPKQASLIFTGLKSQCRDIQRRLITLFEQINQRGEGFFLLENILLRPRFSPGAVLVFETRLSDQLGTILLRGLTYTTQDELSALSAELLIIATEAKNWVSQRFRTEWRTILLKNGSPVLISQPFNEQRDAEKAQQELHTFFVNIRNTDPRSLNNYLRQETEHFDGFKISASFYSLRLSIIAPDWPALFQAKDFRQLFQQTIATNLPAHLCVDYYWLEPHEMSTFEQLYTHWLASLNNQSPAYTATDKGAYTEKQLRAISSRSLELTKFLRPEEKKRLEGNNHQDFVHQGSYASLLRELGEHYGYAFMFDETDFGLIQTIGQPETKLLNALGIRTWRQLQKSKVQALKNAMAAKGLPHNKVHIRSWQRQAGMAHNNRWKDLLRLQRRIRQQGIDKAMSQVRPTSLLRETRNLTRGPVTILRIREWVERLPSERPIPLAVITFLQNALGYGFILPETDLEIFSCIDTAHAKALKARRVNDWQGLLTMRERTWKGIQQELDSAQSTPDIAMLRAEVKMALAGSWDTLIEQQAKELDDSRNSAIQQRLNYHKTRMMAPSTKGDERLLAQRINNWKMPEDQFEVDVSFVDRLISIIGYTDLVHNTYLRIFKGISPRTEVVLHKIGVANWNTLASVGEDWLRDRLKPHLSSGTIGDVGQWIEQARLAAAGSWKELTSWQKGPVDPAGATANQDTALEQAINQWFEDHNLRINENVSP